MTSTTKRVLDKAVDALEKCSSPASRAGKTVERVGKMNAGGVPHKVIAMVMTERSTHDIEWTEQKVAVVCDLYRESETQVLVTASQATALMDDYALNHQDDLDHNAVAVPA